MLSSNAAKKNRRDQLHTEKSRESTTDFIKEKSFRMAKIKADCLSEIKNSEKIVYSFKNLKDFPKLGVPSIDYEDKSCEKTESNEMQLQKSWLTVVNSNGNNSKFNKSFPAPPNAEDSIKNQNDSGAVEYKFIQKCSHEGFSSLSKPEKKEVQNLVKLAPGTMKNCSIHLQRNSKKKRTDPILINLNEILQANKNLKKSRQDKVPKSKFHRHKDIEHLSGNFLDSSNPKRSRGKHREANKKKLTNLKLAIIKERIVKQKIRERALSAYFETECSDLIQHVDFKLEIEKYLMELNKRKIKKLESKSNNWTEGEEKVTKQAGDERKGMREIIPSGDPSKAKKISGTTSEKELRFSAKLREYCENTVTPDLNSAVSELIKELVNLQDKLFARDPIKAKAKRRHVSGIKEVNKHLSMKKVKMIIIAPNLEKLQMEGSVFDLINDLKSMADSQNVPCVFALDRYKLGRCTKKTVPVSAFAVLNYEGIETLFENVLRQLKNAKENFAELTKKNVNAVRQETEKSDVTTQVISSFISAFREGLRISEKSQDADDQGLAL